MKSAPFKNAVVTAGVFRACQTDPGFRGFLHRALNDFGTGRGSRIFCKFNEPPFPGISLCQDPMGRRLTVVTMDGEY